MRTLFGILGHRCSSGNFLGEPIRSFLFQVNIVQADPIFFCSWLILSKPIRSFWFQVNLVRAERSYPISNGSGSSIDLNIRACCHNFDLLPCHLDSAKCHYGEVNFPIVCHITSVLLIPKQWQQGCFKIMVGSGMLYNQSKYSLAWPWNFGNSSSKTRVFVLSDHVSSGSDLNAPLGQLLEPISSSETRDVKPGLERKSSNLAISGSWNLSWTFWKCHQFLNLRWWKPQNKSFKTG